MYAAQAAHQAKSVIKIDDASNNARRKIHDFARFFFSFSYFSSLQRNMILFYIFAEYLLTWRVYGK